MVPGKVSAGEEDVHGAADRGSGGRELRPDRALEGRVVRAGAADELDNWGDGIDGGEAEEEQERGGCCCFHCLRGVDGLGGGWPLVCTGL